ncbi:MAG: hypothetical protein P9L94_20455 [Candidatus Hinthialibacter antarcticus]|nr:hypothetical protein [Candidatus Hinthialibacter antarcticus]
MKFLYALLTIVWLSYGWACFQSMRWEPPRPAPRYYARYLQQSTDEVIDRDINERRLVLSADNLSLRDRSRERYQLSFLYLLKAFHQSNHSSQQAFFDKALEEALAALKPFPDDWPSFWMRAAEIYGLKDDWDNADEYYRQALEIAIKKDPSMVKYVVDSQQRARGSRPPS